MSLTEITDRQWALLRLVRDTDEPRFTFALDVEFTTRHGAGRTTVGSDLGDLEKLGLVHLDRTSPRDGQWVVTPAAEALLERADRQAVGD